MLCMTVLFVTSVWRECHKLQQESPGIARAHTRRTRLELERQIIHEMETAVRLNKLPLLNAAVIRARQFGMTEVPQYAAMEPLLAFYSEQVPQSSVLSHREL